jgi:tripeptide aminopeptidase
MCRVNTPARHEKVLIDEVQPLLEELGLQCVRDTAHQHTGGDSGNLIATLPPTSSGSPSIFFSAHFDTVEPNPGAEIIIEDGIIRTDGTSILGADDKGGMAPILEAVRCVVEHNIPHGEVQLLLTVSEEIGLLGARYIDTSRITSRLGFVLDTGPPVGSIVTSAPSQNTFDITITGRPAHAGFEPEKGISAIQCAAHAIERMKLGRIDEETTANVGVISGGLATNIVCPSLRMRAEARSRNAQKLAAQTEHMQQVLHSSAQRFGAGVDIQINHTYEAYHLHEDSEVIRMAWAAAERLGLSPQLKSAGGGSDANYFNRFGIPTTVLGTGMRNIHTHQECIAIQDLVLSAQWVLEIIRLAAEPGSTE